MIKLNEIIKQLQILTVLMLCALMLIDAANGPVCFCESSEVNGSHQELSKESLHDDSDDLDDSVIATDEQSDQESEHSDCQDQSCFCCTPKLAHQFSLIISHNEEQIVFTEIHQRFLPRNSLPPPTPPPKTA